MLVFETTAALPQSLTLPFVFFPSPDDPITSSTNNSSKGNDQQQQNSCIMCQSEVVYSLLALNILFILVIIGESVFTSEHCGSLL